MRVVIITMRQRTYARVRKFSPGSFQFNLLTLFQFNLLYRCESNGCCWDYSYNNETMPNQCGSDQTGESCWGNDNENDCLNFGCCWDPSNSNNCFFGNIVQGESIPQCFHPAPDNSYCAVPDNATKVDCNETNRFDCENAGM